MERGWVKTKMVILKRTGLMMPKRPEIKNKKKVMES